MPKVFVLGLLVKQPMHGYEIYEYLKSSQIDRWSDILPGSIYYALNTLSTNGFIRIKDNELSGNRNKAIYEISEEGKGELVRLLKKNWEENLCSFPKKLYSLLAFIHHIPKHELKPLIEKQIKKYEEELMYWDIEKINKSGKKIDDLSELVIKNGRKHIEIDIELLTSLLSIINESKEDFNLG